MTGFSNDGPVRFPDLDPAYLGIVERFGMPPILCYDYDLVIQHYVEDGMSEDEAVEFFEYNVLGAWLGDRTPCFIRKGVDPEEVD